MIEVHIEDLNLLMKACVFHGGDAGGAYYSDPDGVREVLQEMAIVGGFVFSMQDNGFGDVMPIILRKAKDGEKAGEV